MSDDVLTAVAICIACLMIGSWVHHLEMRRLRRELAVILQRLDGQD